MIDSHCHINDKPFIDNPSLYIEEASSKGVNTFLVVGCNLKTSIEAIKIADKYTQCYAAIGIHPSDAKEAKENDLNEIEKMISKKVIAIGEIGLDYYWDKDENIKELQRNYFKTQIKLANKYNLPISIHCRDAYGECYQILKENPVKRGGVLHAYAGSPEMAKQFTKLGFYFGFGGTVTFKNAKNIKENCSQIPLDRILLETDAPYLTPVPHRGETNHSKYLCYVRDEIARIKNVSPEEVDKITTSNFEKLFYEKGN